MKLGFTISLLTLSLLGCNFSRAATSTQASLDGGTTPPTPSIVPDAETNQPESCVDDLPLPLVRYTFEKITQTEIWDTASPSPDLPLQIPQDNNYLAIVGSHANFTRDAPQGGQLESDKNKTVALSQAINTAGVFTAAVWLSTSSIALQTQYDPARILTLSKSKYTRGFTIGQEGDQFVFRVNTTATNNNGSSWNSNYGGDTASPELRVDGYLPANKILHVAQVFDGNSHYAYLAGKLEASGFHGLKNNVTTNLNWDTNELILALGNEIGGSRPWLGSIFQAEVYATTLNATQIKCLAEQVGQL